jgi:hypothetical protein
MVIVIVVFGENAVDLFIGLKAKSFFSVNLFKKVKTVPKRFETDRPTGTAVENKWIAIDTRVND